MHIPDGFLDPTMAAATYAVFLIFAGYAVREIRRSAAPEQMSLVATLAAGVFAAQMLNWPLPGGTSLHFVGGALAGILLGPWLGFLALFLVLLVQCLVFHDGGITALGANVLNMGIIGVLVGYAVYRVLVKRFGVSTGARALGAFLGGWLSMTLAGVACGLEIGISPSFPFGYAITVPVMGFWHAILGIIEAAITAAVVVYIAGRAPGLIAAER